MRILLLGLIFALPSIVGAFPPEEEYLNWNAKKAEAVGKSMYGHGRVGGFWDTRGLATDRSHNYKLAATWLTPDVVRATARLAQLTSRLSEDHTKALVAEAEAAGSIVIMVEIDPREGSGIVPAEWQAFLQPKHAPLEESKTAIGVHAPQLRRVRALAGVLRRNYDYDRFWVVFPYTNTAGKPLFSDSDREAELIVRIYDKEGRVTWPIPVSVRRRMASLSPLPF